MRNYKTCDQAKKKNEKNRLIAGYSTISRMMII